MVNEKTIQILKNKADDPRLGRVIGEAIDLISSSQVQREDSPIGPGQSSQSIADLQAFRQRSGFYKADAVTGLDETIARLRNCNCLVRSIVIETSGAYIAIWIDDHDSLQGVLIFRKNAQAS